jgi:ribonuclease J
MAEKLKIIPLGGLNEIGKNITAYEFGGDILVVDCGLGFPDDEMYGVDIVIPDFTYLVKNKNKVRALVLTHGHEDHIGAVPYFLRELNIPIYATPMTAGLVEVKLTEHGLLETAQITTLTAGESFKAGCFKVEFIHINHSIPGAVALAIKTPVGMLIHTGDFKVDTTPISGSMIDLARLGELGNRGVLALLADSTNVEKPGYSMSERKVGESFDELFRGCTSRILVTTFASNVHRIQQVINCAVKYGRRVAVTGRSMENIIKVATELGCMEVPKGVLAELNQIKGMPPEKVVIVTTGSQGETMSALYRIAFSDHRQIEIKPGDRVIISASAIPGNEKSVSRVVDELFRRGADVFYDKYSDIHVSGHAYQEELKMMMALTKPKFFIPLHGEYRHLCTHAKIALQMGIDPKNIMISDVGQVLELTGRSLKRNGSVPSGKVFVDGTGVGDVGAVVLRDRKHLAQDGMLVVIVNLSSEDGSLASGPDIITRGFIYVKESEDMMRELKDITVKALEDCASNKITDFASLKGAVKTELSNYLYKKTKRNPMILPVITEI